MARPASSTIWASLRWLPEPGPLGALATRIMNTPGPAGCVCRVLLGDQVLAFPRRAVDDRDGVVSGPGPDTPREPPRQPHQVSVVQHRIRLRVTAPDQPPPPGAEPARAAAQRIAGVQHDPVHAVIRAGQQPCIPRREVISHALNVSLSSLNVRRTAPKGPFLPGEVREGT